jgi:ribose-phosphate pyrophosphokinase
MIDTAGTICKDAKAAQKAGARRILVFATHGLLSGPAIERINDSPIEEIVITDSIAVDPKKLLACRIKITILPISSLMASAIQRIHNEESLSDLILR